eukprot:TRINITY_DN44927_c0_g1_i1.p1 TRINITY_DN44927_c0_g1~~TRINITY_DN44927_c0_g1_i1.p1  ORF type:complete len:136 (+),score=0.57 TRINITY_DN44927_c0_g1_i1:59-409(+)
MRSMCTTAFAEVSRVALICFLWRFGLACFAAAPTSEMSLSSSVSRRPASAAGSRQRTLIDCLTLAPPSKRPRVETAALRNGALPPTTGQQSLTAVKEHEQLVTDYSVLLCARSALF